jgi:ferredoxin--NADP+ reductase
MERTGHVVGIFGGAVSGSEAAHQLTQKGIEVVVFEQNALPYGKIEDGLPKWHVKLRDKEEAKIDEKLSHPLVTYVPNCTLGDDVDLEEVSRQWGFSAIILAIGAWRDRPLPVDNIDQYVGKGFYYQNPFIYWFNHYHESEYKGPQYEYADKAVVIGGGLASLDVVKSLMFLTVTDALRDKGLEANLFTLERSIAKALEEQDLTLKDLGVNGCTLYYRRRIKDMPLTPMPTDTPEQLAKAEGIREKIMKVHQDRYLFHVEPCRSPVDMIVENDRLVGLVFVKNRIEDGRPVPIEGSEHEVRAPLFISSIGSIPQPIDRIPMRGQVYKIDQEDCCKVEGFDNVFAVGNAVTGRGNIKESAKHSLEVVGGLIDKYLSLDDSLHEREFNLDKADTKEQIKDISSKIEALKPVPQDKREDLFRKVKELQTKAGFTGDYEAWRAKHLPERLEAMLGIAH